MKKTVRLTEQNLHRIIKESVNRILSEGHETGSAKRELEDAINNTLGVLHTYNEEDFEALTKQELDQLYEFLSMVKDKISQSYEYGPYEGEPYHFGN